MKIEYSVMKLIANSLECPVRELVQLISPHQSFLFVQVFIDYSWWFVRWSVEFFEFDSRKGLMRLGDVKFLLVTLYTKLKIPDSTFDDKISCEHTKGHNEVNNVIVVELE
ncbi:hypothetical protein Tco_0537400, partial [Tanacetum coccineum]